MISLEKGKPAVMQGRKVTDLDSKDGRAAERLKPSGRPVFCFLGNLGLSQFNANMKERHLEVTKVLGRNEQECK